MSTPPNNFFFFLLLLLLLFTKIRSSIQRKILPGASSQILIQELPLRREKLESMQIKRIFVLLHLPNKFSNFDQNP
jgi:hypothetical protein